MPFGLASAASVFQRVMSKLLEGMEGVVVFQDDVLIFAKYKAVHEERLKQVFKIF